MRVDTERVEAPLSQVPGQMSGAAADVRDGAAPRLAHQVSERPDHRLDERLVRERLGGELGVGHGLGVVAGADRLEVFGGGGGHGTQPRGSRKPAAPWSMSASWRSVLRFHPTITG